jgi:hypothetical protein
MRKLQCLQGFFVWTWRKMDKQECFTQSGEDIDR